MLWFLLLEGVSFEGWLFSIEGSIENSHKEFGSRVV